jgi:hypothetical protein
MRKKQKHTDHDSNGVCESCLITGAGNVLEFADLMIEHTKSADQTDSPVIPIKIGELIALVMQPPCACGECDNLIDAQSIANYVIERMASTN